MGHGGARPNSGPKTKAEKLLMAKSLADWFTPDYQKAKWQALVDSKDEQVQLRAMSYLCDRLYGKAAQAVDLTHGGGVDVNLKRVIVVDV